MDSSVLDHRERSPDPEEALRVAWDGFRAGLWTALPGIVQSFDSSKLTVVVQPSIQGIIEQQGAPAQAVNLPLLSNVPVQFQRGGNATLTFPIAKGDECLVIFASRNIDAWWQLGGVQLPMDPRMHDLSDGFALIGPFSQLTKIANYSATTVQLRSNDGSTYVELDPTGQIVNVVAPGGLSITAPTVAITGALSVSQTVAAQGNITSQADVKAQTVSLHGHVHAGVQGGPSSTSVPTP